MPALATPNAACSPRRRRSLPFSRKASREARLAPLTIPSRSRKLQAFNAYLCATVHVAHAHRSRGARWADEPASLEDMKRKRPADVGACFELIETRHVPRPVGDGRATIRSPIPISLRSPAGLRPMASTPARFPRVAQHFARMARTAERQAGARREAQNAGASVSDHDHDHEHDHDHDHSEMSEVAAARSRAGDPAHRERLRRSRRARRARRDL